MRHCANIPLLRAFRILDAISFLWIRFNVRCAIVFALIRIACVPIPVKPIFSVRNDFGCALLITFDCMTVDSSDLAAIQYLSSSSREVLCRPRWWQRRTFWQCKCSHTIMLKSDHEALTISSVSEMYPTVIICLLWARDSSWVALRFWLPCHISKKLWTLASLCIFLSSASFFMSELFSVFVESNSRSAPAKILLLGRANCLTMNCWRRVPPVVFDCLQPMTSRPMEKWASTPTLCGMIENISCATLERWACFEFVSACWHHRSVMSGNHNVLLISIGSEWYSFRFGLSCPKFFGTSGGNINESLAVVNRRAVWSLGLGVVSATLSGVEYSSSSMARS